MDLHYSVKFMYLGFDEHAQYLIILNHLKRMIMFETITYPYRT
jgi:hypothetical protein